MPITVKKYNCFCLTEQSYVTVWSDKIPTVCPNNNSHLIDENNIGILDVMNTQSVFIQGKAYDQELIQGMYMYHGNIVNIGTALETIQDVEFKVASSVLGLSFMSSECHRGDYMDIIINPDTTIGVITATVNPGDTEIQVDANVLKYLKIGWYIALDNGTTYDNLGMVININVVEGKVTFNKPCQNTYAPWITPVKINIYIVKDYGITEPYRYKVGYGSSAGKDVTAGTVFRMVYHNNSGIAKVLNYQYELNY